ncbi:MAG: amino acid permease [Myxococcales bacterium]|nr:amino acid permease [Myxococcales bacterium]
MSDGVAFKRNIGLFLAVMIGIGAMMGPGIFALPGELAGMVGPLGILVYLVMGVVTIFTALNYSELGAAIPLAGGGYSMTARTLPRPISFLTGWFFWIGNTLACAMYALIFAVTIRAYFLPDVSVVLVVVLTTVVFTVVNLRGMSEAIKVITVMNLIELAILVGVAALGVADIEAPNLTPLAPHGYGEFVPSMALIYISYVGFELITVAAEEIIDPARTIPRAIFITLAIGVAIYVFVIWVMMGTVHHTELAKSDVPFIFVAERLFGAWGRWAAVFATIMASLSAFSVTLGASARILYALGRDGHFPRFFATLHKRYRTPHVALLICAGVVVVTGSSGIVKFVASVSDFGYLMGLGIVNYAVIALHQRMPNLRRPFKVAWYPWVPILGIISCWAFVPALELRSFALGGILTAVGSAIYLYRPVNRKEVANGFAQLARQIRRVFAKRKPAMRILIIGGGRQGQNIAQRLMAKDEYHLMFRSAEHQITFIEPDPQRCKVLEQTFNVPIFEGDGTKEDLFRQVGIENIDVAIAASGDDGKNVISGLQAKRLGVKRVIAIVQDPEYLKLLEEEGISAISAPWATAAMVENFLDRPGVADLFDIGTGVASLTEVVVPANAKVAGQRIRDIDVPHECVVAAVIRGKKFVVPRGDTVIEAGDEVVFVGPSTTIKTAADRFIAI